MIKGKNKVTGRDVGRGFMKWLIIIIIILQLVACFWATFVYSNVGIVKKARHLWVETAMSTADHQWLATAFIPKSEIDKILTQQVTYTVVDDTEAIEIIRDKTFFEKEQELEVGDMDLAGNEIVINDKEENITIVRIHTEMYDGRIAIIDDPQRVYIGTVGKGKSRGKNIMEYLSSEGAVMGMNASGFPDANGVGSGSNVVGLSCSQGELWGSYVSDYNTIAFDEDNKLLVGIQTDWKNKKVRDGMQFNPALIINGEQNVKGTAGWGLQPRTAIAQREDGVVLMLVVDGRQPGHSIGATMEDLVKEFQKYDVINAAACDGGSSSIMGYKDEILTKCSSPQKGGRYLPNAFLVKSVNEYVDTE